MKLNKLSLAIFAYVISLNNVAIAGLFDDLKSKVSSTVSTATEKACPACKCYINLNNIMRKLWTEHVVWTRFYIIAALNDAPDKKAALDRLMKNQEDIGDAIAIFYGQDAGKKLTELLKDHIKIAGALIEAAKKNSKSEFEKQDKAWHQNADALAVFLSGVNAKNWAAEDMKDMFYKHLKLTIDEVQARLGKKWLTDVKSFDAVSNQALEMADMFTDGLIIQFPEKALKL